MTGTWINAVAVFAGGLTGLVIGARLPDRVRESVFTAMGLFTLLLGVRMFLASDALLPVLLSLVLGGILGEMVGMEDALQRFGQWSRQYLDRAGTQTRFVEGFLTASLLFCVGPMTIIGALEDGLKGDYTILATKSVLDGFSAVAFAAAMGTGVLLSIVVIVTYQGGLSLLAGWLAPLITQDMMSAMSAAGGVLLAGLAISSLLELRPVRVGNLLPALVFAPLLVKLIEPFLP